MMVITQNGGNKLLALSKQWDVLGPFQIGTREATWGADPLECRGGFRSLEYNPNATFHSSLAPNGLVYWTRHNVEEYFETASLSSSLSCALAVVAKLVLNFAIIDWQSLQAAFGWAALQWQAWARGAIQILGEEPAFVLLYIDNVLEFWVDDQHYFGGDLYGLRRAPLVLHLTHGDHTIDVRLVRDVRSMGSVGQPSMSIQFKAEVSDSGLAVLRNSSTLPDTVSGVPAGRNGSVNVLNTSHDWISIGRIECLPESINCFSVGRTQRTYWSPVDGHKGDFATKVHQEAPLTLAPGQSRPLMFNLIFSGTKLVRFCLSILYTTEASAHVLMQKRIVCSLTDREPHDAHKITFLHPSGIVSYAILRPPSVKACGLGRTSMPVLLNLHGAGLDADSWQVRTMLDPLPDLPAWVLFPTGVTPWSGDDWHSWGFGDVEAAINSIPSWIETTRWKGPSADTNSWVVSGHSNGGQGAWYALTHRPDKLIGAAPVSGYASIQGYVPYQLWHEADPKAISIVQAALLSYRHELLIPNISGIPVLQQHGSADDNVPVYHSRRLNQLISHSCQSSFSHYYEIHGKGHWYDGVMTTEPLKAFFKRILDGPGTIPLPFSFSVVVANPADTEPRGGLSIEQLRRPDQLGKMEIVRDRSSNIWALKTSNIIRFAFRSCPTIGDIPSELVIDGQRMGAMSKERLLSRCFACTNDGSWSSFDKSTGCYGERQRSQMGPLDSLLRSSGRFLIQVMSSECMASALQVSRNLFQYFAADTEIIGQTDVPQGQFTLISIGKGRDAGWINQKTQAIQVSKTSGVSLDKHDGTRKVYGFEDGMGVIFLCPFSDSGLELIIWGLDDCGLRHATRLLPMLTGVGQPEFIIVRKRCAWEGAAGVLAMGSFDRHWRISKSCFIT